MTAQEQCDAWNAKYPSGTVVYSNVHHVMESCRRTVGDAYVRRVGPLESERAVVVLDNDPWQIIELCHLTPLSPPEPKPPMTVLDQCDVFNAKYAIGTPVVVIGADGAYTYDATTVGRAYVDMTGFPAIHVRVTKTRMVVYAKLGTVTVVHPQAEVLPTPQQQCDAFNAKVKVGDAVSVTMADKQYDAVTSSASYIGPDAYVMIKFDGFHLPVLITNVRPKPKVSPAQAECDAWNAMVKVGDLVEIIGIGVPGFARTDGLACVKDGQAVVVVAGLTHYLTNVRRAKIDCLKPGSYYVNVDWSYPHADFTPSPFFRPLFDREELRRCYAKAAELWGAKAENRKPTEPASIEAERLKCERFNDRIKPGDPVYVRTDRGSFETTLASMYYVNKDGHSAALVYEDTSRRWHRVSEYSADRIYPRQATL